jgi:hypothetical protein
MFYNCNEEIKRQKEQTSGAKTDKLARSVAGSGTGTGGGLLVDLQDFDVHAAWVAVGNI